MKKYATRNPFFNKTLREYDFLTGPELETKLQNAKEAFEVQKSLPSFQRLDLFSNLAQAVEDNIDSISSVISAEMGMPITSSKAQVKKSAGHIRFYVENYEKFFGPQRVKSSGKKSLIIHEPIGPIFQLVPFNFPFWLIFKSAIPTLLLGNPVLSRPSETTPGTSIITEKLFLEAGFHKGAFQSVLSEVAQTEGIIGDPRVKGVSFTGSTAVGRIIGGYAGKNIKPSVLELGGSDPFILLYDGDVEKAVSIACSSRLLCSGQVCFSSKRFIIHRARKEEFIQKLKARFEKLRLGNPMEESTQMGPLAKEEIANGVDRQLKQAIEEEKATLVYGGKRVALPEQNLDSESESLVYLPTIIDLGTSEEALKSILFKEEVFGPVFAICSFEEESEAIEVANSTGYGLGATIVSQDEKRAESLSSHINAGMVFVNSPVASSSELPSGGIGNSGYGRECSKYGVESFANIKTFYMG